MRTSVVDAAGAIYVVGGNSVGTTYFNDVWVSTDGGARPDSVGGVHWVGTRGGTQGVPSVLQGYCRGTAEGTQGCYRGY